MFLGIEGVETRHTDNTSFKLSRPGHLNGRSNSKPCHKSIGNLEVELHAFLTSTLDRVE